MIKLLLDRSSPTPLYQQIVQAIRWHIGTGTLRSGDLLPTIREAAKQWNVNYHTVRRAYRDLASAGWVESIQGSGTHVAEVMPTRWEPDTADSVTKWIGELLGTARIRYGLSAEGLIQQLRVHAPIKRVLMVECNRHQSEFLARQLEDALSIEAVPWPLEEASAPPQLPMIGTYFHHAEMRSRWPNRVNEMYFVALHLDPALKSRLQGIGACRRAHVLRLVERDPATAQEMAAGVSALLSPAYQVRPVVGRPEEHLHALRSDELLLVAPRLWDEVGPTIQADERVFDVRYVIVPEDLRRLRFIL